jgi:hypothetical protein
MNHSVTARTYVKAKKVKPSGYHREVVGNPRERERGKDHVRISIRDPAALKDSCTLDSLYHA